MEGLATMYPLGRTGETEDVARVIAFLASDEASWMTGQNVAIDGGIGLCCAPENVVIPDFAKENLNKT